jgi:hypothetical protein
LAAVENGTLAALRLCPGFAARGEGILFVGTIYFYTEREQERPGGQDNGGAQKPPHNGKAELIKNTPERDWGACPAASSSALSAHATNRF